MTRPSIPAPGPHGGDAHRLAAALGRDPSEFIDLSASLNPLAPDVSAIIADIARHEPISVTRYPDPAAATDLLAAAIGTDRDRLVLCNGAAEAIALVADEFDVADVIEPEFSLYRRHLGTLEPDAPRWRSNPSNPLGTLAAQDDVAAVWDESFYPLATGRWSRGDDCVWRIGSLTKLWACPGLRLGYAISPDPDGAERVRRRQPRWAVNGLALAALPRLLDSTDLAAWRHGISAMRHRFAKELRSQGFSVTTTDANWVLIDGHDLRERLAPHGVVVRDCTSFGLRGMTRVAVPPDDELDRVLTAFAAVAA